jgi:hypothetical protein
MCTFTRLAVCMLLERINRLRRSVTRLLFQLAQKLGDENEIMNLHGRLENSIED